MTGNDWYSDKDLSYVQKTPKLESIIEAIIKNIIEV